MGKSDKKLLILWFVMLVLASMGLFCCKTPDNVSEEVISSVVETEKVLVTESETKAKEKVSSVSTIDWEEMGYSGGTVAVDTDGVEYHIGSGLEVTDAYYIWCDDADGGHYILLLHGNVSTDHTVVLRRAMYAVIPEIDELRGYFSLPNVQDSVALYNSDGTFTVQFVLFSEKNAIVSPDTVDRYVVGLSLQDIDPEDFEYFMHYVDVSQCDVSDFPWEKETWISRESGLQFHFVNNLDVPVEYVGVYIVFYNDVGEVIDIRSVFLRETNDNYDLGSTELLVQPGEERWGTEVLCIEYSDKEPEYTMGYGYSSYIYFVNAVEEIHR